MYAREGRKREDFQVLHCEPQNIGPAYSVPGTVRVKKYDHEYYPYILENYIVEPDTSLDVGTSDDFQNFYIIPEWEVPTYILEILDTFDCHIDEIPPTYFDETSKEYGIEIDAWKVQQFFSSFPAGHDSSLIKEEKIVRQWSGKDTQVFVFESDFDRDDIFEDVSELEEFKDLELLDYAEYSTGHYELFQNEVATWLCLHSDYFGENLIDDWFSVPDDITNVEDAIDYVNFV